jgi:hypothetical protein
LKKELTGKGMEIPDIELEQLKQELELNLKGMEETLEEINWLRDDKALQGDEEAVIRISKDLRTIEKLIAQSYELLERCND